MSGYADEILADKGIPSDEFAFVAKPVSASVLLTKIRELLDGTRNKQVRKRL